MKTPGMTGMLCLLLVLIDVIGLAEAATTYVSNESHLTLRVSITYVQSFGTQSFQNRIIAPGTYQSDQYTELTSGIQIYIKIEGSARKSVQISNIKKDRSVVAFSNNNNCVNIYLAKYGTRLVPDGGRIAEVCNL